MAAWELADSLNCWSVGNYMGFTDWVDIYVCFGFLKDLFLEKSWEMYCFLGKIAILRSFFFHFFPIFDFPGRYEFFSVFLWILVNFWDKKMSFQKKNFFSKIFSWSAEILKFQFFHNKIGIPLINFSQLIFLKNSGIYL